MQRRNVGKVILCLVAVLALASAIAMVACSTGEKNRNVATTTALGAATDANHTSVNAVVGQTFTIADGRVFNTGIGNNPVTFQFPSPTTFVISRTGTGVSQAANGTVTFGSCILQVTASTFPAGQGPQVGNTITLSTCNINVTGSNIPVGGSAVNGTVTLVIVSSTGSSSSSPITASVSILDDGTLVVNGVNTNLDTDVTGTTGTGGTP